MPVLSFGLQLKRPQVNPAAGVKAIDSSPTLYRLSAWEALFPVCGLTVLRFVSQGRQALLRLRHRDPLSTGIILHLIFFDFANAKTSCSGMGEVPALPGLHILIMDLADDFRPGQNQYAMVASQIANSLRQMVAAGILLLGQPTALNHGSHCAVQDPDLSPTGKKAIEYVS